MNTSYNNYKYALFGGTFDPVHNGHIRLAKAAANELGLDKLFFMPNFISPFKRDAAMLCGFFEAPPQTLGKDLG